MYDIPTFNGINEFKNTSFIPFNYAKTTKDKTGKSVHFYLDDYQFERLWNRPEQYLNILEGFEYICQPDFSLFTDMPYPVQLYNHYRKQWLARFYEDNGFKVIPTMCWSDERSYEFCFDGVPKNGIVTVSSVGIGKNKIAKDLFIKGYNKMIDVVQPNTIIFYGEILADEIKRCDNVVRIEPFYKSIRERCK